MNDLPDTDPQETLEWRDALQALIATQGPQRASYILGQLAQQAQNQQVPWAPPTSRPYVNTVSAEQQPMFPGDLAIEERLGSLMRWNALAMVARANAAYGELGGHIASYASAADLFEVGFNHFFHARDDRHRGDLVFFQPHSAPGVYARAYMEGRLSEQDLSFYRRELTGADDALADQHLLSGVEILVATDVDNPLRRLEMNLRNQIHSRPDPLGRKL